MQEFQFEIESWELIPGDGGRFELEINGELRYSKLETGRHAEIEEIRDIFREAVGVTG